MMVKKSNGGWRGQPGTRHRPEHRALYNTKAWTTLRKQILSRDDYRCQWPGCGSLLIGRHLAPNAPIVHHKLDHKGDWQLFTDPANLMAVCKACHDRAAQEASHRGFIAGHDEDGRSIDPGHPWAK
ncbi:HNH endonuclease [Pseudogemmobacter faecipullorum]|uniref:HNH endonuclease n=1 Tax=Pseudogemmobacter faecipullorum TaxID=2755041 RepID=A0ABS8CRN6_9RHOB|nr:HNH endonuclease signature motif containing protein [Pseudogemmobacter faecipullorum]MCB5411485.1 HNH endonuclease [Pseudogemmobacter faecipullorum]